jgi:hypothetical protein
MFKKNLMAKIIDQMEPAREAMISGIAAPSWGIAQANAATAPSSKEKIAISRSSGVRNATPTMRSESAKNAKKVTETIKCIRPADSGKTPMAKRLIADRTKKNAPAEPKILLLKTRIIAAANTVVRMPPIMRPELKINAAW